ncbi:MAG: hypothetical protein OHK0047_36630 [Leptolyngbyaceae cyanobacterium]
MPLYASVDPTSKYLADSGTPLLPVLILNGNARNTFQLIVSQVESREWRMGNRGVEGRWLLLSAKAIYPAN